MGFIVPNLFQATAGQQAGQKLIGQRIDNFGSLVNARNNEIAYLGNRDAYNQNLDYQYQFDNLRQQGASPQNAAFLIGQTSRNPYVSSMGYATQQAQSQMLSPYATQGLMQGDPRLANQLGGFMGLQAGPGIFNPVAAVQATAGHYGAGGINNAVNNYNAQNGLALARTAQTPFDLQIRQLHAQNAALNSRLTAITNPANAVAPVQQQGFQLGGQPSTSLFNDVVPGTLNRSVISPVTPVTPVKQLNHGAGVSLKDGPGYGPLSSNNYGGYSGRNNMGSVYATAYG